ncbi:hypothetical protein Nepgr_007772 [Nepenthes gracilis]|uniref:Pentatricopeptide repeat-containing protein n=1 Tax=Nepenthes gracilis TaxID=150966 RepID=A0AAD3S7H3_NEPGR|nr:hypothetical protein Nepgr_007772 [Nepenthes gracilis]
MYSRCVGVRHSELAFKEILHPDLVSWNAVIAASAQHGLYSKACALFSQMGSNAFQPDSITFLGLLPACNHAGDCGIWGALLSACNVHLNADIGELAAKKILELDPWNSGASVMLSNVYAARGIH